MTDTTTRTSTPADFDVIVVGAGFAGMYMLHKAREVGLSVRVIEAGSDVGGTWYWNRYPGARCDVESLDYCYGFSPELLQQWTWSERFATQPEILGYINHVADRFDLRRDIDFDTRVIAAVYDDVEHRWSVTTDAGAVLRARFCVMATGCLSLSYVPPFADVDRFRGRTLHTGRWPHEPVDVAGQRVGIIGTGSSGIQLIPELAKTAGHLTVFQRTPNFSLPARNAAIPADVHADWKAHYPERKAEIRSTTDTGVWVRLPAIGKSAAAAPAAEREQEFERRWELGGNILLRAYEDVLRDADSNELVGDFVRRKISEIVVDPAVAAMLTPTDHHIGTKRICVDTDYYATFNRENVTLVDVRADPIERFTETALQTRDGTRYELDIVVFATGYDAMTGPILNIDVRGRDGVALREAWADGPATYLGLMVHGFPNFFIVAGPGSPSVRANMVTAIEQHVDWIAECITRLTSDGNQAIEASRPAQDDWVAHNVELAAKTLFVKTASWYTGANIAGKPQVFAPYAGRFDAYVQRCDEVAALGYAGFEIT